jgi:hypothetical protein
MKIDEFVANVLKDINAGILQAKGETHRGYSIGVTGADGVSFDIAVTTTYSSNIEGEGKAKIGIIEVLGAGVAVKAGDKSEKNEVSRIQFSVHVPSRTREEEDADTREIQAINEQNAEKIRSNYGF